MAGPAVSFLSFMLDVSLQTKWNCTYKTLDFIYQDLRKCWRSKCLWLAGFSSLSGIVGKTKMLIWNSQPAITTTPLVIFWWTDIVPPPPLNFVSRLQDEATQDRQWSRCWHLHKPRTPQLPTAPPPWNKEHPSLLSPHTTCSLYTRIQATLSGCHGENPLPLQSPHLANTNILSILLARWRHAGLKELQQNSDGPQSYTQLHPSTKHTQLHERKNTRT